MGRGSRQCYLCVSRPIGLSPPFDWKQHQPRTHGDVYLINKEKKFILATNIGHFTSLLIKAHICVN